jgi:type I restriction enzyme S subunit
VKAEWIEKSLGEICSIARGGSPRPIQAFLTSESDGINWVKISDATASGKNIYETAEKIKPSGAARSRIVKDGDFLLSNSMSFGRPYIMRTTGCVHDGWLVLSEYQESFNQDFLYHLLGSPQVFSQFDRLAAGSTVRNLNIELASKVIVPIPTLEEQRRIVTLLDEAFADIATAKANAEKNLQNARDLFESHLQTLFAQRGEGWKDKTLEEISTTFGRGKSRHRPRNDPALYGGQYPFVQTGDVRNAEHIITEFSQTYSEAGLAQSKLWPKGTICITIAANIAETGILGFDACFPDSVIGVVPDPKEAEVGYVEYVLQSFKARLQALGQGSAQANINMGTFENERFPFPSVAEQRGIVTKLDALSEESQRLESIYRKKLTALDDLKKSLLHQAFSGQL